MGGGGHKLAIYIASCIEIPVGFQDSRIQFEDFSDSMMGFKYIIRRLLEELRIIYKYWVDGSYWDQQNR